MLAKRVITIQDIDDDDVFLLKTVCLLARRSIHLGNVEEFKTEDIESAQALIEQLLKL